MTPEEARTVLDIMSEADGGCPYCAANLFTEFRERFPEYAYIVDEKVVEYKLKERLS